MIQLRMCLFWSVVAVSQSLFAEELKPETVFDGLAQPCGVVVQSQTGHVFVAESGKGRVVRIVDGKLEEVVVDFPLQELQNELEFKAGPIGLCFLGNETLLIGGAGNSLGEDVIYVASVPQPGEPALKATDLLKLGPVSDSKVGLPLGDYYGVAVTDSAIFATGTGTQNKGGLVVAAIREQQNPTNAKSYGPLIHFPKANRVSATGVPAGIVISPRKEVVVGQIGQLGQKSDSRLTFYQPSDGAQLLSLETHLRDVIALTYGALLPPSNKSQLYALDLSWAEPNEGGLYRLDAALAAGKPSVLPVKLASLRHPTAMTLAENGTVYVTLLGATSGNDSSDGKLLVFAPGL